jgi:hypothetical protein
MVLMVGKNSITKKTITAQLKIWRKLKNAVGHKEGNKLNFLIQQTTKKISILLKRKIDVTNITVHCLSIFLSNNYWGCHLIKVSRNLFHNTLTYFFIYINIKKYIFNKQQELILSEEKSKWRSQVNQNPFSNSLKME